MANRQITITNLGTNFGEIAKILNEVFGGDAQRTLNTISALPTTLTVTNEQLEALRAAGATVVVMDETIVMEPIGTGFGGQAVTSAGEGPNGLYLYSGYMEDWMVNDPASGCVVFRDALLLMVDKVGSLMELYEVIAVARNEKAPLVILSTSIDPSVLSILKTNHNNGLIDAACVIVDDAENVFAEAASKFGGIPVFTSRGMNVKEFGSRCLGEVKYVRIDAEKAILEVTETAAVKSDPVSIDDLLDEVPSFFDPEDSGKATAPVTAAIPVVTPAASGATAEILPWEDWDKLPDGHSKTVKVMRTLRDHADHYRSQLRKAEQELNNEKSASQRTFDAVVDNASKAFEEAAQKAINEYEANTKRAEQAKNQVKELDNRCSTFANQLPAGSVTTAARNALGNVSSHANKVNKSIDNKVALYGKLREARIVSAQKARNDKEEKAKREQLDRNNQSDRKYKLKVTDLEERCRKDIEAGFNKETTAAYKKDIEASRFRGENFEGAKSVPEYIMLGKIGLTVPMNDTHDTSVVNAMDLQTTAIGSKADSSYDVEIPYAQRLTDGISLLIQYAPAKRTFAQSQLQHLVMKIMMSLPPGKVEVTRIDPIDIGKNFIDLGKLELVPDAARLVDTKVWSSEAEIESALTRLRKNLTQLRAEYGSDRESRIRKESIKVLAIADFPNRFNENALRELHTIVRNSAELGVCVFICSSDKELATLKGRYDSLIDEIQERMVQTRAEDGRFIMTSTGDEGLYLRLDEMRDYEENKDEILGRIITGGAPRRIEYFDEMFKGDIYDSNTWGFGNPSEISVPIGIKGADTVVDMVLGRGKGATQHHALVTGVTGAGKSTFLHTLITSAMITYRPEDLQMYLLDFKEGVEFNIYTKYRLPSLRVVALNSELEFGLSILRELCDEFDSRTREIQRADGGERVKDIYDYNRVTTGPKMPRIVMIFDEVQELFRKRDGGDPIADECIFCIGKLVSQGRAMGIHLILATQDFNNCPQLKQFFSVMSVRIVISGSDVGAGAILNSDNDVTDEFMDKPAGYAVYNSEAGARKGNNFFQVATFRKGNEENGEDDQQVKLMSCLDKYYTDPAIASLYEDYETRILLTSAESDINNCFNQLILKGPSSLEPLGDGAGGYGLFMGQGFGKKSVFVPAIRKGIGENMLIVTKHEDLAMCMFELSALSILYEELNTDADKSNALIYMVDLSAVTIDHKQCDFRYFGSQFSSQVTMAGKRDLEGLINNLYEIVMRRKEGSLDDSERVFLMLFGLNRAKIITMNSIYGTSAQEGLSPAEKLRAILREGPTVGVNSIVWSETVKGTETMLGYDFDGLFNHRVAYDLSADDYERLVEELDPASLKGKTAAYMQIREDVKNTHFRPYEVPSKEWVESYAEAYQQIVEEDEAGEAGFGGYWNE